MLVMGLLGALCTAAYMTRAIWYVFYGEPRGTRPTHEPHENGPRITVPLIILAVGSIVVGFANLPDKVFGIGVPESLSLRFEHYVEPTGAYFPSAENGFTHAGVHAVDRPGLRCHRLLVGIGPALPLVLEGQGPARHHRAQQARPRRLHGSSRTSTTSTGSTPTSSSGFVKGPIARATNWFNQNVIDGVVNLVGKTAREAGGFVYDQIDQGVVDTRRQRLRHRRRGHGPGPAQVADRQGPAVRRLSVLRGHHPGRHLRSDR